MHDSLLCTFPRAPPPPGSLWQLTNGGGGQGGNFWIAPFPPPPYIGLYSSHQKRSLDQSVTDLRPCQEGVLEYWNSFKWTHKKKYIYLTQYCTCTVVPNKCFFSRVFRVREGWGGGGTKKEIKFEFWSCLVPKICEFSFCLVFNVWLYLWTNECLLILPTAQKIIELKSDGKFCNI